MTVASARPRLRTDLVVSRIETPEGPRFVLKDPQTKRYFRLRQPEYAIARRLDGSTGLADVARSMSAELDLELDADALDTFVAQLREQRLLEDPAAPAPPRERFVRGSPLYLRFRAFDPDRLLDRLVHPLRFFFTPWFVGIAALSILWATATVIANNAEIIRDLRAIWSFQSLFLAWLVILLVVTLHEFAHGLTCKHFGGHVHEMGFLLIYFQPAFYCNVSDAWLFPRKSHRLWVTAAGAFFELFLWSIATLVWTVVEPGTWISGLALIVIATSAVKQFFNLNPLIKLDGYYLLGDLLDTPNLRQRAVGFLGDRLKRLVGARASTAIEVSSRERAIFVVYGAAAFVFSYWFLAHIVLGIGSWLTTRYQGPGFVAFAMFLGVVFPQPLRRLRPGRRAIWLSIAAAMLVLATVVRLPLRVGSELVLLPARNADVPATTDGIIERVYVEEGDVVRAGDTIARLSEREQRARLVAVEADVAERDAQLRLLKAGARREELVLARLAVARAEEPLRVARAEAERVRILTEGQVATRTELERAVEQVNILENELAQARGRLAMLSAGSRPEEIAATVQSVARAAAERDRLEGEIGRLVIVAPHEGVIVTPRMSEKMGKYVKAGDLVAEVHAIDHLRAEIGVSERDIGEVRIGEPVAIRLRAYPSRTFRGTVTRIAPALSDSSATGGRTARVEVDLPNPDGVLRPMMTGYARIDAGDRRVIDLLTRRVRRYIRVEFWSWW